jgi:glycosyltransferase domain-containing protein
MNNKVTIITTPHSDARHPYLKRFLSYYEHSNSAPNIIVTDSSPSPISDDIILEQLTAPHVTYEKFSHDTRFENKLLKVLGKVKTPYAAICSEDDFITLKGISKSIKYLENNDDIVAVYGYLIAFHLNNNEISIRSAYSMQAVNDESISNRLGYYISKYPSAVFSAIYRTEVLKHIWNLTLKYTNDHEFGELLPAFLTPIYGRIHSLQELYWVREYFIESTGQKEDLILNPRLYNIVEDGSYSYKYNNFRQCMVNEICGNSNLDIKQAEDLVNTSFEHYFYKRFGCNYKQLRRKILLKKALKKAGLFSFAKGLKSKIIQNPVIVSQEQNYEDDPLFPKNEWDEMKIFLENNMIQS